MVRAITQYVVAAVAAILALVSGVIASSGRVSSWERSIFDVVNGLPDALRYVVWLPMQLGTRPGPLVAAAVAFVVWRNRRGALAILLSGALAGAVALSVKQLELRARPPLLLDDVNVRDSTNLSSWGFMSSHAAIAFALVAAAVVLLPRRLQVVAWVIAIVVAAARVYVGVHFPLDVLAGAAVGYACGVVTRAIFLRPPGEVPVAT